jgi:hypothetical protein
MHPFSAIPITDEERLSALAMQSRGTRRDAERRDIARESTRTVHRLIQGGRWDEMPAPEDQLPDDRMPREFFDYWLGRPGCPYPRPAARGDGAGPRWDAARREVVADSTSDFVEHGPARHDATVDSIPPRVRERRGGNLRDSGFAMRKILRTRGLEPVRSAESGVRRAECGERNSECGERSAECGVVGWALPTDSRLLSVVDAHPLAIPATPSECGVRNSECGERRFEAPLGGRCPPFSYPCNAQ